MTFNCFAPFRWMVASIFLVACHAHAQYGTDGKNWPAFGGDHGNTKYAPLDQIDKDNFTSLEIAWRWVSITEEVSAKDKKVRPLQFKVTPIVADGRMFVATSVSQVAAVDAGTGETLWTYDPESYKLGRPANLGWQHRGVGYWTDGEDARVMLPSHDRRLIALNAKTGETYPDFGENGFVDLTKGLGRKIDERSLTFTSPPAICRDTVVVGSIVSDRSQFRAGNPGHVRGYDARTGEMKWVFHTIPQAGEFGVETWEDDSWKISGETNVWSTIASDEELGYVYVPVGSGTSNIYGGHRKGDNLFAESIVCLDAETGERVWHFQIAHHGLWDYDIPTAPNLLDVVVDGKPVKAVAQVTKQAFAFAFNRVTGKPLWPIEERPVPQSTVPGERTSPTQPFPTKPAPYDRQGLSVDDLIDFTPELREMALDIVNNDFTIGPLYNPPRTTDHPPVVNLPGDAGGTNWPGAAVDPELGYLFVPSTTKPRAFTLVKPDPNRSDLDWVPRGWSLNVPGPRGLPLTKPPYSRITAINLNTGDHAWMEPHGDGPREHPALRDLNLPPLGTSTYFGAGPLVTKTLFIATLGGRDMRPSDGQRVLSAYDKKTGEYVGAVELPTSPNGNPITYLHNDKQYIAVAIGGGTPIGGGGTTPEIVALALPD